MISDPKYTYNKRGSKGSRVGQAVTDILSEENLPVYTAEDVLKEYQREFVKELESTIQNNYQRYSNPFYVFVLTGKEHWAANVVRNWFMARQTAPSPSDMMMKHPHKNKILYKVDSKKGEIALLWTLPGLEECKTVLKNPHLYDPHLTDWVRRFFTGTIDEFIESQQLAKEEIKFQRCDI